MRSGILDTGINQIRNVGRVNVGPGSIQELPKHVAALRKTGGLSGSPHAIFLVDCFFEGRAATIAKFGIEDQDYLEFIPTANEPTTDAIDQLVSRVKAAGFSRPATVVGIGGGITLDTAKAVANLLTNGGRAEDYQGWDLLKVPAAHKIGVPTISGTGAETTRTCVMINTRSGLKLGMNSDHTVFDHIILDPELTETVPRNQFFYTGMDAYIHSVESLAGAYRNAVGDAYAHETLRLCREVFLGGDMMSPAAREQLMVASYLGGCAIATSYVGVVHPLSAGLSVVLGLHHCLANCVVMRAVAEYYPAAHAEFWSMAERQGVDVPSGVARGLSDAQYQAIYAAAIVHQKPLTNALGDEYRTVLTFEKTKLLLELM